MAEGDKDLQMLTRFIFDTVTDPNLIVRFKNANMSSETAEAVAAPGDPERAHGPLRAGVARAAQKR